MCYCLLACTATSVTAPAKRAYFSGNRALMQHLLCCVCQAMSSVVSLSHINIIVGISLIMQARTQVSGKGGYIPGVWGVLQWGSRGQRPLRGGGAEPPEKFFKTKLPESHVTCQDSILHWFTILYKCIVK